ncbi:MAG: HAD-IC family P-type ATPase [Pseudanabaenaceae cyanobacterium bins.68]|nr:HAD-IC family P-type ATPase [Pseudanabaenaceae cyanobacterium bins.68]
MQPTSLSGVSTQVAEQLLKSGQGNNISLTPSRTYWQIVQQNLLTFINMVFFGLGMVLISLGSYSDAFLVVVVILGSVVVSVCQELWAKRKLDQIAILTRPKVTAWRDQVLIEIDPSEIVLGDLLEVKTGDQVVVDGQILSESGIDLDESLITGESEVVHRQQGDQIFSGSICVSGQAFYRVEKVGKENLAFQITQGARAFRQVNTPLQQEINLLIRIFLLVSTFLWILVGVAVFANIVSFSEGIQRAAVIAGLVPAGLYLAITLAYALGAVRMLGQKVLVQQANAVESISNVEILCLDKTGTLTANHLHLEQIYPVADHGEAEIRAIAGDYVSSCSQQNSTSEAIAHACPGRKLQLTAEVPFNSTRKWSGITLNPKLSYILGAPEAVCEHLPSVAQAYFASQVAQGRRVLLLAIAHNSLYDSGDRAYLPSDLAPLALLTFKDQLRPAAQETLASFAQAGITLKIISGDNPQTVLALAKQVGMNQHQSLKLISGSQLEQLDPIQFEQVVLETNIFGRITPEQKSRIIQTLRQSGKYVAMIGDGVNDVLSLKQANLGIAMESGSKATRNAADIVLLEDSFASLPQAFLEGQKIRNGIQDVIKLFMVRVLCFTLLIFATSLVGNTFPFLNKHSAAITLISVGLPSTFLPIFAKSGVLPHRSMIRSLLHFDLSAILTLSLVALGVYLKYLIPVIDRNIILSDQDLLVPRSAIASILIFCNLLLVPFLKPPTRAWVAAEPLSGDWRYTIMAFSLIGFYMVAVLIPPLRNFFDIAFLGWQDYGILAVVAITWAVTLRTLWRSRFLDKFLGVSLK